MRVDHDRQIESRERVDPLSLALASSSAVAIGCVPFVTVELYRRGFDTASVMFWRAAFGVGVLVPAALLLRAPLVAAWRAGGWVATALGMTVGTLQTYCYFRAIERLPTSIAILLFFLYPLVTIVLQRIAFGTRASPLAVLACLAILVGAGMSGSASLTLGNAHVADVLLALVPPFTYAGYAILIARHTRALPTLASASFIQLGSFLGFTVLVALSGGAHVPSAVDSWVRIMAVGILGSGFHALALAYSLPRLGPTGYGVVTSFELVTVVLLGVWLLGEAVTPMQWLGVALVLAGILIYRPAAKSSR